jgi:hypothetical protein
MIGQNWGAVMIHDHFTQCGTSRRDFLVEQLLTSFIVGLFGLVAILMYRNDQLGYILALQFHQPVLIGGFAVLVLVVFRAISLWCGASHRHHDDEPGHSHDLSWMFSRLLVLCFPVGLFLLGLPNSGFSQDRIRMLLGGDDALTGNMAEVAFQNGTVVSFQELNEAAFDEGKRESLKGQTAILEGRIRWIDSRQFTLYRLKMTCCAADVVPLKVRIVLKSGTLNGFYDSNWVQMKGQIQFVQAPNSERYIPVIVIEDIRDIMKTEPKNKFE